MSEEEKRIFRVKVQLFFRTRLLAETHRTMADIYMEESSFGKTMTSAELDLLNEVYCNYITMSSYNYNYDMIDLEKYIEELKTRNRKPNDIK